MTSALVGGEWQVAASCMEKGASIHWIGGWVDPRAGPDDMENSKLFILPGLPLSVAQPVASRYTDYATAAYTVHKTDTNVFSQDMEYMKLRGLSLRANYTVRATATCWRSKCQLLRIDCHVVSVTDPCSVYINSVCFLEC
jgi:hypothetical protein